MRENCFPLFPPPPPNHGPQKNCLLDERLHQDIPNEERVYFIEKWLWMYALNLSVVDSNQTGDGFYAAHNLYTLESMWLVYDYYT